MADIIDMFEAARRLRGNNVSSPKRDMLDPGCVMRELRGPFNDSSILSVKVAESDGVYVHSDEITLPVEAGWAVVERRDEDGIETLEFMGGDNFKARYPDLANGP